MSQRYFAVDFMTPSIAERLKSRKLWQHRLRRNDPSTSKNAEESFENGCDSSEERTSMKKETAKERRSGSEEDEEKRLWMERPRKSMSPGVKKKIIKKSRRSNKELSMKDVRKEKRSSDKKMHFGLNDNRNLKICERAFNSVSDDYHDHEAYEVPDQTTNICNQWKQVAHGIELLVETAVNKETAKKRRPGDKKTSLEMRKKEDRVQMKRPRKSMNAGVNKKITKISRRSNNNVRMNDVTKEKSRSDEKIHFGHSGNSKLRIGERSFNGVSNENQDREEYEVQVLDQNTNSCNPRKQVSDGIKMQVNTKAGVWMNCESKSRSKENNFFFSTKESEEKGTDNSIFSDSDQNDDGKLELGKRNAFGLSPTSESKSRSNRYKSAISPKESYEQVANGIEMLVKRTTCISIEESKGHGSKDMFNDSDQSDDDIMELTETKACGLRISESNLRSNQVKHASNPEESYEPGIGFQDQLELNRVKKVDEFQSKNSHCSYSGGQRAKTVKDENGGNNGSSDSLERNNSDSSTRFGKIVNKNIKVTQEEGVSYFSREARLNAENEIDSEMASWNRLKTGEVEKASDETSSDCSQESLSSSSTENDDSDDEDFNIETYNSSASERSLSSFADEDDEKDGISKEVIEENSDAQVDEETNTDKNILARASLGKKRRRNVFTSHGISDGGNKNEVLGINEENEQQTEHLCPRKRANRKVEGLPKSTETKPMQPEEESAWEKVNKPYSKEISRAGMKKWKTTCRTEAEKICMENHIDCKTRGSVVDIMNDEEKVAASQEKAKIATGMKDADVESDMRSSREDAITEKINHLGLKKQKTHRCTEDSTCENSSGLHDQTSSVLNCHETNKPMANCMKEEIEKLAKKERFRVPKHSDFCKVLLNSILGRGDVIDEDTCEEAKKPSSNAFKLPLKFRFEDDEPKPVEKSEYEIMVDGLFFQMDSLMYGDTSTFESPEVDNKTQNASKANENKIHGCCNGKHDLIMHDEIGEICRNCRHVQREYKDIMEWPEFPKSSRRGMSTSRFVDNEQISVFDGLDFTPEVDNFGYSFSATNGTVWDVIPGVWETMYQHQQQGFEFLWKNLEGTIDLAEMKKKSDSSEVGGCIISHAPGTGKTRLTIVFIQTYLKLFPSCRPVIIAPASMLLTWEEEFRKWQVDFPFHNLNNSEFSGKENKKLLEIVLARKCPDRDIIRLIKMYSWSQGNSILGISYRLYGDLVGEKYAKENGSKKKQKWPINEQSENLGKVLLELPGLVVFDEGHTPRSQKTRIWNTLVKLQTERRIILSGTPFQNNFRELFNTLRLVRPKMAGILAKERTLSDMIKSTDRYSAKKENSFVQKEVEKGVEKLKEVIAPFVHVHEGSILQKKLPGLRDCVVILNPPPHQKSMIEKIEFEAAQKTFEYDYKVALLSVHPSLLEQCSLADNERSSVDQHLFEKMRMDPQEGAKTKFIMELVQISKNRNEKVLVFSQFIQPLRLIKEQLNALFGYAEGKEVFLMQGELEQKNRQIMINRFNDPNSDAFIFLASTKCCSEGISLVGASRIVLLDVVWNPSVERQAICRAYRLGQKKVVHTYHLMTAGTTESDKYYRQAEKDRLSELVFSSNTKENEKRKHPASAFDDTILEEMLGNAHLKDMFQKVIYQPKEANLMESFGFASPV
ncbi:hypothetical protein ACH5RR_000475 [Cinchona calisaya]|uniref:Uncharacterized protein n=1 Tax=Cinchona calisaya TaxID=153742 RepID=A0ABD3B1S6_9GENT